jgi:hypothetical protein
LTLVDVSTAIPSWREIASKKLSQDTPQQMNDLTKRVERWYRENREPLAGHFSRTRFQDKTGEDPIRGAVNIQLERSTLVATITVWGKGNLAAEALKAGWKGPASHEDRVLGRKEDIASMLDSCVNRFLQLTQLPSPGCGQTFTPENDKSPRGLLVGRLLGRPSHWSNLP